ncbi:carbon-phosphorus lyase complex subunit PhnI [Aquabacter spiritensis]|uniref:Alpha-D-ribose 1-methylphosphonate 5-triphosphate synthase subunit PhnI n=1 Tax=Aquabacter spiritensis TaxID=933073 RepID=A0A4R3LS29_9HYPH|nr:carbon-phosphorus lyase complex subunit PhnI [Aquabacter spiritensis]TCT02586.1 alpha-D-ribose 1-methylphosphonate 5-triphosphate synthase subunit PhnI [Aquabacter spiritensis]
MYVAVKGGETAIRNAHALLAEARRGDPAVPEIGIDQIREQLALAVDRVMAEGSLFDRDLAALALKQARGDTIEAIFLLRALRTTLPRFGAALPVDTATMTLRRRISATFKDLPGGQLLGPTFDYTHRLLDPALATQTPAAPAPAAKATPKVSAKAASKAAGKAAPKPPMGETSTPAAPVPRVTDLLGDEKLIEPAPADTGAEPPDLTRTPLAFPADRATRLQNLARGDEGFLLALGYSTQRGYARTHPFVGEIRIGEVEVELFVEELGFAVPLGAVSVTECQMVNQFHGTAEAPPQFTRGYGLVFGQSERKAMSMALVDRAMRWEELGETLSAPAQDAEFVLSHSDNVQSTGFVEHLKLPHYVDFQAELGLVRLMRGAHAAASDALQDGDPE